MSIDAYSRAATEITIRPEPSLQKGRAAQQAQSSQDKMWGGDGFGFDDLIDIVNPLQHIPIVSSIYRELTGDEINPGARLAGGAMLGGVFGVMAGAANMMIEEATGDDVVGHVVAAFTGEADTAPTQMLAAKEAPAATKPAMEMAQLAFDYEKSKVVNEELLFSGETNLMDVAELCEVDKLKKLFNTFNQKRDILHLLEQAINADGIQIFIGEESGHEVLGNCSVVTSPYEVEGKILGVLGVIGPTRMHYERVIPIVDVTAKMLGLALNPNN